VPRARFRGCGFCVCAGRGRWGRRCAAAVPDAGAPVVVWSRWWDSTLVMSAGSTCSGWVSAARQSPSISAASRSVSRVRVAAGRVDGHRFLHQHPRPPRRGRRLRPGDVLTASDHLQRRTAHARQARLDRAHVGLIVLFKSRVIHRDRLRRSRAVASISPVSRRSGAGPALGRTSGPPSLAGLLNNPLTPRHSQCRPQ